MTGKRTRNTTMCHNMTVRGGRGEWLCLVAHPRECDTASGAPTPTYSWEISTGGMYATNVGACGGVGGYE
jgi:hypothetical protein